MAAIHPVAVGKSGLWQWSAFGAITPYRTLDHVPGVFRNAVNLCALIMQGLAWACFQTG